MTSHIKTIYFDHNATTAVADDCLAAMDECLRLGPINPSSKHSLGDRAKELVSAARSAVAAAFGAAPAEIVFTSGGTEANHLAILGSLAQHPQRRHIVSSAVEHPSTLMLLRQLETQGVRVSYLPVDGRGALILDALADTLSADTALVSLMWANNETGVLFPIEQAAELTHARGALFHTDAVQAAGKLPIDLKAVPVDLLSLSGHKLYAPAGTGALYVRKGIKLAPQLAGHQERGRRGGTENVAGIVALGVACAALSQYLPTDVPRLQALRERLEDGVLARVRYARINGAGAARVANTSNIRFGDLDAEIILGRLDRLGICASAGAACSSGGTKPSHVLRAMGLSPSAALASVRFSLGRHNTGQEVDELLRVLPDVLNDLAVRTA
ncbi:MAG: cysteine desulfurase family protein [Steroidobacteraceae bacterium]